MTWFWVERSEDNVRVRVITAIRRGFELPSGYYFVVIICFWEITMLVCSLVFILIMRFQFPVERSRR